MIKVNGKEEHMDLAKEPESIPVPSDPTTAVVEIHKEILPNPNTATIRPIRNLS